MQDGQSLQWPLKLQHQASISPIPLSIEDRFLPIELDCLPEAV